MSVSMSSKTKVDFIKGVGESIVEASKKLNTAMEEARAVANSAKYAAVDRVYNTLATLSTDFSEMMCKEDKKVLTEIIEQLEKRTDIGEAFVTYAKKTKSEIEGIPSPNSFDKITDERDGSEVWDSGMQARLSDVIDVWSKIRADFITSFAEAFRKIEEEEFRASVKPIGKSNEEFTNSIAKNVKLIDDALTELGISTDKFNASVSDTSSSAKIEDTTVKPNLMGADV